MAEAYNDEDLDRLRHWWQENGVALMLGLGIAIVVVGGWQFWNSHTAARSTAASAVYAAMQSSLTNSDMRAADEQASTLTKEYGSTPYAVLANLMLARAKVETGKYDKAIPLLLWVVENASDEGMAAIASLRLARVQWSLADYKGALETLKQPLPDSFAAMATELRGDIWRAQGALAQAHSSYVKALQLLQAQGDAANQQAQALLQQKIADTDTVASAAATAAPQPAAKTTAKDAG